MNGTIFAIRQQFPVHAREMIFYVPLMGLVFLLIGFVMGLLIALDNADEENCKFRCTSGEFRCRSNDSCIQDRWVCDGTKDCQDGSDEAEDICTSKVVISRCDPDTQLRCTQSRGCYDLEQRCDGQNDCSDGTDELDCDEIDVNEGEEDGDTVECSDENVWKCDSHDQCISLDWVCDGDID